MNRNLVGSTYGMFDIKFSQSRMKRRILKKILTNQKQELPVVAMFVNGSGPNVQFV
jgi:hypothetical protein